MIPEWKKDLLREIQALCLLLYQDKKATSSDVKAISKEQTGVSQFHHLQHCTDVMLKRLKNALELKALG